MDILRNGTSINSEIAVAKSMTTGTHFHVQLALDMVDDMVNFFDVGSQESKEALRLKQTLKETLKRAKCSIESVNLLAKNFTENA